MSQNDEKAYPAEDDYPTEDNVNQERAAPEDHEPASQNGDNNSVTSDDAAKKSEEPVAAAPEKKSSLSIPFLIFAFMTFGGWVLCMGGIAIGMMDSKEKGNKSCISIWGPKPKCTGTWFRALDWQAFNNGKVCDKGYSLTQAAQAFSVMSVIGGFLVTVVAVLELLHFAELAVVAGIMASINCVATLVTWATMMAYFYSNMCGIIRYRDHYKIGNGLILFITAWCMQMVGLICLMIGVQSEGAN